MAALNPREPPNQGASVHMSQFFLVGLHQEYSKKLGARQESQERPLPEAQTSQICSSLRAKQVNGDPASCTPDLLLNKHVSMRG